MVWAGSPDPLVICDCGSPCLRPLACHPQTTCRPNADCSFGTTSVDRRGPPSMPRRAGYPLTEQMSRKLSRKVRETRSSRSRKRPERGQEVLAGRRVVYPWPEQRGCNLSRKVRATRSSSLCSAHLARITRCKFLQSLRYLCQFMYMATVKRVLRNSFDLNYLRKMCGTWVQAARLPLEPGEAEKRAAFLFRSPRPCFVPPRGDKTAIELFQQGVSTLFLQLSIASTALVAILAASCSEQTSPK